MISNIVKAFSFLVFGVALTCPVQSTDGTAEKLWSIDLRHLPQIAAMGPLSEAGGNTITFLDQNRIALDLNFPASVPAGQSNLTENAHKTLLIVVDAKTGNVEGSRSWPEVKGGAYNTINWGHANSGDLLLLRENHLFLLSSALELLADRALDRTDLWYLLVDSSGSSALLLRTAHDNYDSVMNHWISTSTLKDLRVTPGVRGSTGSTLVVNESVIFNPIVRPPYDSNSLKEVPPKIFDRNGQTRQLCASCPGAAIAAFGHDFIVVAHHPRASYSVVNARSEEIIFDATHGDEGDGGLLASAAFSTSNRIALQYGHIDLARRTSEDTLIVFDADKRSEIMRMNLSYAGQTVGNHTSFTTPRLAMSPDGKLLAVMGADTLQVLKIP
ncbi:MAG: hypothetical protein WB723_17045 [Candidatus Acidiferrales bacterium]